MAVFFPNLLNELLNPVFLKKVRKSFHYGESHVIEFQEVAAEILPLLRKEAFWERKASCLSKQCQGKRADVVYEDVVMSLGEGLDYLQERYNRDDMLSKSYMLEALASELLMKGYDAYECYIRKNTDYYVAGYHFFGSEEEFPFELLPQTLQNLTKKVTCNAAFCMTPKKSIVFAAELTQDDIGYCRGICSTCSNICCAHRRAENDFTAKKRMAGMTDLPLSYGYSRIFGRYEK